MTSKIIDSLTVFLKKKKSTNYEMVTLGVQMKF